MKITDIQVIPANLFLYVKVFTDEGITGVGESGAWGFLKASGDAVETAYVRGIASLYEFDFGDLSGWTYTVNGVRPSIGCGACKLHDGDRVVWEYTVSL